MPVDPLPYSAAQIGQLPLSGDPRTTNNYFLRVIKALLSTPTTLGAAYDVPFFVPEKPTASQVVLSFIAVTNFTLPVNLTGSIARAKIASTAITTFDIRFKSGAAAATSVGSLTFAAAGTVATFTFAAPVNIVAGDELEIVAPAVADATLSGIRATLKGVTS